MSHSQEHSLARELYRQEAERLETRVKTSTALLEAVRFLARPEFPDTKINLLCLAAANALSNGEIIVTVYPDPELFAEAIVYLEPSPNPRARLARPGSLPRLRRATRLPRRQRLPPALPNADPRRHSAQRPRPERISRCGNPARRVRPVLPRVLRRPSPGDSEPARPRNNDLLGETTVHTSDYQTPADS